MLNLAQRGIKHCPLGKWRKRLNSPETKPPSIVPKSLEPSQLCPSTRSLSLELCLGLVLGQMLSQNSANHSSQASQLHTSGHHGHPGASCSRALENRKGGPGCNIANRALDPSGNGAWNIPVSSVLVLVSSSDTISEQLTGVDTRRAEPGHLQRGPSDKLRSHNHHHAADNDDGSAGMLLGKLRSLAP